MSSPDDSLEREELAVLSNEYATVVVNKVWTHNGVRLEIRSPKLHHHIIMDPLELESLSWQDKDVFSKFLETPFGPEDE